MYDLFLQDITDQFKKENESIKSYFFARWKNSAQKKDSGLQAKINLWRSLETYENLKLGNHGLSVNINELHEKYKNNLDANPETFVQNSPNQSWQSTFELAIADFISKKFPLLEKNYPPDLIFSAEKSSYFIECGTVATSLIDKYDDLLPKFDLFFMAAELLCNVNKSQSFCRREDWYFEAHIEQLWYRMPKEAQIQIKEQLDLMMSENQQAIAKINEWMKWNRYACLHFKNLLPAPILERLESIDFPMLRGDEKENIEFMVRRVGLMLCDKLEKSYFQNNNPGIIAISLSLFNPGLNVIPMDRVINCLLGNFFPLLESIMDDKSSAFKKRVYYGLKNLYAIIIDGSHYNWFPDILNNGYSGYRVIYNECLFLNPKYDGDIFCSLSLLPSIKARLNCYPLPVGELVVDQ